MDNLVEIKNLIYEIRGLQVMLDSDLAKLYGIETSNLNKAVKRNIARFPEDFMFQLTKEEYENLIFQLGISSSKHGGRRFMPYVFTEQGIAMLSSVLNSEQAININIQIMRIFVKLKQYALTSKNKACEIEELRKLLMLYIEKNDSRVNDIIKVLNNLIEKPKETKHIGF
ncbi:ORF6N domain-containing protein [bacterium]|nr:ORF6N domain-containing protein [bacterium]